MTDRLLKDCYFNLQFNLAYISVIIVVRDKSVFLEESKIQRIRTVLTVLLGTRLIYKSNNIRETEEELGLKRIDIKVLGCFHDALSITDMAVTPVR
jgi:hypothetical protein